MPSRSSSSCVGVEVGLQDGQDPAFQLDDRRVHVGGDVVEQLGRGAGRVGAEAVEQADGVALVVVGEVGDLLAVFGTHPLDHREQEALGDPAVGVELGAQHPDGGGALAGRRSAQRVELRLQRAVRGEQRVERVVGAVVSLGVVGLVGGLRRV